MGAAGDSSKMMTKGNRNGGGFGNQLSCRQTFRYLLHAYITCIHTPKCIFLSLRGCVKLALATRWNQEVGFTQPLKYKFAL